MGVSRLVTRFGIAAAAVAVCVAVPSASPISLSTSNGLYRWVSVESGIGNTAQYGSDNGTVFTTGAAWEAANPGWNTSLSYDDSAWQTYTPPSYGDSVAYLRYQFNLSGTPSAGMFTDGLVDDDFLMYVNGSLVFSDDNYAPDAIPAIDILPYLVSGPNLIAFKLYNSNQQWCYSPPQLCAANGNGFGQGSFSDYFDINGFADSSSDEVPPVPEPATLTLLGTGLLGAAAIARKRKKKN